MMYNTNVKQKTNKGEKMQKIALDLGYGDTKVKTKDKMFKFPSAIESVGTSIADFGEKTDNIYSFNGKEYKVGENVFNAISTRNFNFLVKYAPLLAYHSIKKAGLDTKEPIHIVTGLSLHNWAEKDKFLEALSVIKVNDEVIKPKITLMAQGQGIYNESDVKSGLICVEDIGFNTVDCLVFENGIPEKKRSFATNQGVNVIIARLQSLIHRDFNINISEQEAKDIFVNRGFTHFGEKVDLTDDINDLVQEYIDFLINEIKSRQLDIVRRATKVIFGGGGAYLLENASLPANAALTENPHEFANVRGYFNG